MSQLVPFDSTKLPAHIKPKKVANAFAAAVGGGFKVLSIKSKVFTIVDGDSKEIVTKPGDDAPASNLEVVILAANAHKSKVYYKGGYTEGSSDKPLCYSNNGIQPEDDAQEPQAKKCATCAHNVFGSKITENGQKAKACSDSIRIAVAPSGLLNDPMLLRVPAASMKALGKYGADLALRGVEPHQVVTKVGFDYTVAYPALTFKAVSFVSDAMLEVITQTQATEVVGQIIGTIAMSHTEEDEAFVPAPPAEARVDKIENPPKKPAAPVADDEFPAAPRAVVRSEKAPPPAKEDAAEELGVMVASVGDLDFDD